MPPLLGVSLPWRAWPEKSHRTGQGAVQNPHHIIEAIGCLDKLPPVYGGGWTSKLSLQGKRTLSEILFRRLCVRIAPGEPS